MLITDIKRQEGENEQKFLWRIGQAKDGGSLDATWDEIASIMNREFRADETEHRTEAAYRKNYANAKLFFNNVFSQLNKEGRDGDIDEQIEVLRKERVRLQDERAAHSREIRNQARLDQKLEWLEASLREVGKTNFAPKWDAKISDTGKEREMVVMLSDLHIGAEFYSIGGVFNPEIALERISRYTERIKKIQEQYSARVCQLAILGDLIDGAIHLAQRVESSDNVIEQVKTAAMLVANFITQMSTIFETVNVYNVSGNHSRIERNKDDSMRDERMDDMIGWCAENMLAHLKNVVFNKALDGTFDEVILGDRLWVLCHGDFDDFTDAGIGRLCFKIGAIPYGVIAAHGHYPELSEVNGVKVVRSGSLCGSGGDYCMKKRLTGKASQTVLLLDDKGIEAHFPVCLE